LLKKEAINYIPTIIQPFEIPHDNDNSP